ncbi:hypothetical protein PVAG01_00780 [Phlyctema vagabunda]|uniref:Protein kinase domain-containing protein n=1 Tax=Phlyctema vagabunda TaxID=108571 RepID=A0ABR4PVJ3_9HELO
MAPKFKAWTVDSSSSSSTSSEEESASYEYSAQTMGMHKQEGQDCHDARTGSSVPRTPQSQEVAYQNASGFELPNLQPHQHSALFYLSLVEGRCKSEAMKTLNSKRASGPMLSEDHPEVCDLAQRIFEDISNELSSIGILPAELAGAELASLRAGYLASFDQRVGSAISRQSHEPQGVAEGSARDSGLEVVLRGTTPSALTAINTIAIPGIYTMSSPRRYSISADSRAGLAETIMDIRVIGKIGGGGYGSVYKALQQTDNKSYAIKVVPLNSNAQTREELISTSPKVKEALEEVLAMASLSHDNVVQYHWAWLHRSEEPETHPSGDLVNGTQQRSRLVASGFLLENVVASEEPEEDFFERDADEKSDDFSTSSSGSTSTDGMDSTSAGENSMPIEEDQIRVRGKDVMRHKKKWHLYIAMALCDASLAKYLSAGLPSRSESFQYRHCFHRQASIEILHKVIDGLSYIHRNNIVHRDLKPANILISVNRDKAKDSYSTCIKTTDCQDCRCRCSSEKEENEECPVCTSHEPVYLTPRIADFGLLAKTDPSDGTSGKDIKPMVARDPRAPQGTKHYVAPHIKGPSRKQDIYSLGIIAFELMCKFDSQSERHTVLSKVNKHEFPENFRDNKWKEGVVGMTLRDVEKQWDLKRVTLWLAEMEKEQNELGYVCNGS